MSWTPDIRVLKFMKLEHGLYLPAIRSCPQPGARQAASLMYYHAEAGYCVFNDWYTPPRLLGGPAALAKSMAWLHASPAIMQAFTGITSDLMAYHCERDPAVLQSLGQRCAGALGSFGLEEVQGIMAAIQDL